LDYAPKRAEVRFLFSKRYGEAIELYEKNKKLRRRKEIKGKRVEILWILGVSYYMKGNYEKAIEYFDKVLAACEVLVRKKIVQEKGMLDVFYAKAKALEKLGREEEAKKCFENARGVEERAKENITVERIIRLLNEE
jgi:tetratricopeptide (TPR) repeat protein